LLPFLVLGEHVVKDYARAGVDIDAEGAAVFELVSEIKASLKTRKKGLGENLTGIGHFCSLIRIDDKRAIAIATDGVGSKIKIAEAMGKYDTIGIDLIAMNVNDLICTGARPLCLVDYLAFEMVDPKIAGEIGRGLTTGAKEADISICGGEIATLPEIIHGVDLAGTAVGTVDIKKIVTGGTIEPGDVVVGLESSGVHSNGLTLARKVLLAHHSLDDRIFEGKSVGEELLEPTKIYVKLVLELLEKVRVKGLANVTGGGLGNLQRITKIGFQVTNPPVPQKVFKKIQELEGIADAEMYRTFNMGVGFCIVVGSDDVDKVIEVSRKHNTKAWTIGKAVKESGISVKGFTLSY
jgi:phosphoribosylformylglycinamidine cyclo-ligase